jgi:gelsolin
MNYSKVAEERAQLKFEDTNMANFGTEMELKVKKNMAEQEVAWKDTRTTIGLQIWRIEKFKVVPWPKETYGQFYDGDSYIILHTRKDNKSEALIHNAYMWIGEFSSQDEYGTAAYKIVELDDFLDRKATLFREVQGHESPEFSALFNNRMQILNGGIESGFVHVEKITDFPGKLYHIRRNDQVYRITECPMTTDSLNNDDCFVLDKIIQIYTFYGEKCSQFERFKTAAFVKDLRDSRTTVKSEVHEVVGLSETDKEHVKKFWELLGGLPQSIKEKEYIVNEGNYEKKLVRVSDSSGKIELKFEATGSLSKKMLDTKDVFIVDTHSTIYTWIGKETSANEKKFAFLVASQYMKDQGRPGYLTISVVNEGSELDSFNKLFL